MHDEGRLVCACENGDEVDVAGAVRGSTKRGVVKARTQVAYLVRFAAGVSESCSVACRFFDVAGIIVDMDWRRDSQALELFVLIQWGPVSERVRVNSRVDLGDLHSAGTVPASRPPPPRHDSAKFEASLQRLLRHAIHPYFRPSSCAWVIINLDD